MRPVLAFLFALPLSAQLQVVVVEGGKETPIVSSHDFGAVAAGDPIEAHFLVRNTTAAAVTVTRLATEGAGFALSEEFSLPRIIAPSFTAPFAIRFTPPGTATYLGRLRINDLIIELRGAGAASLTFEYLGAASPQPLSSGQNLDLGSVIRHATLTARFRLANRTSILLTAEPPSLAGADWRFEDAWSAPRNVQPGDSVPLTVVLQPATAGVKLATLRAASRDILLRATAQELPVPKSSLRLTSSALLSAREERLSIQLDQPATDDVSGTLTLQFAPDSGLFDDRAIAFLPSLSRTVPFRVRAGSADADFGGAPAMSFQTGTTAGTITFAIALANNRVQETLVVAPSAVAIESARALVSDQSAEIVVLGFDNTRSVTKAPFVFYLKSGATAAPGRIEADVSSPFQSLFTSDRSAGGAFSFRVHFPVSGTASELASVDVEFTNAKGTTRIQRLQW